MININEDGYIIGWNSPTRDQLKELAIISKQLKDKHGNYQYKWDGEKPILQTITLTSIQKEKDRKDKIQKEVTYSVTDELALINKAIINGVTDTEYVAYRAAIEALKTKYPKES